MKKEHSWIIFILLLVLILLAPFLQNGISAQELPNYLTIELPILLYAVISVYFVFWYSNLIYGTGYNGVMEFIKKKLFPENKFGKKFLGRLLRKTGMTYTWYAIAFLPYVVLIYANFQKEFPEFQYITAVFLAIMSCFSFGKRHNDKIFAGEARSVIVSTALIGILLAAKNGGDVKLGNPITEANLVLLITIIDLLIEKIKPLLESFGQGLKDRILKLFS